MDAIDTCSLVAYVRYYLPVDNNKSLSAFFQKKIEDKTVIVLDKVYEQCRYVSKGIVVNAMPYLKNNLLSTIDLLPTRTFFSDLESRFINASIKNKWTFEEFEVKKREFLEDADAKLLLYCLNRQNLLERPRIITEETEGSNDNKGFKKIPAICKLLEIETITLPQLLIEWGVFDLLRGGKK